MYFVLMTRAALAFRIIGLAYPALSLHSADGVTAFQLLLANVSATETSRSGAGEKSALVAGLDLRGPGEGDSWLHLGGLDPSLSVKCPTHLFHSHLRMLSLSQFLTHLYTHFLIFYLFARPYYRRYHFFDLRIKMNLKKKGGASGLRLLCTIRCGCTTCRCAGWPSSRRTRPPGPRSSTRAPTASRSNKPSPSVSLELNFTFFHALLQSKKLSNNRHLCVCLFCICSFVFSFHLSHPCCFL